MVMLDGEKTYRVFENLINNIGKYALDNTRVYIDLNVDEDITISFKNISKAEMNFTSEEIVERFKRGDKSRHQSGSGLGLAIAKSFTEVQEGKFDLTIDGDMFKVVLHFKK
jgi:signal transduction histidine kinase